MSIQLPLFPLDMVLFPSAPVTLHIFEERYREMIGFCLETQSPFGIILLRDSDEDIIPGEPYDIGTTTAISASMQLEDGRFLIIGQGAKRFRTLEVVQHAPYIVAEVEFLPDDAPKGVTGAAREVRMLYRRYWQAVVAASGLYTTYDQLPPDALALSYHVAHHINVDNELKQHWLEIDAHERLYELADLLRMDLSMLPPVPPLDKIKMVSDTWSWN